MAESSAGEDWQNWLHTLAVRAYLAREARTRLRSSEFFMVMHEVSAELC